MGLNLHSKLFKGSQVEVCQEFVLEIQSMLPPLSINYMDIFLKYELLFTSCKYFSTRLFF